MNPRLILSRGFVNGVQRREDEIRNAWRYLTRADHQRAIAKGAERKGNVMRFAEVTP